MKKNLDEFGVRWEVKPKDPAMAYVRALNKKNFSLVVLPRSVYMTGQVPDDMVSLKTFASIEEVRLSDCMKALEG